MNFFPHWKLPMAGAALGLLLAACATTPPPPPLEVACADLARAAIPGGRVTKAALVPAGKHVWTFYPWILALAVTTGSLWYFYKPSKPNIPLETIVWCFTAGALCVYILVVALALS